MEPLAYNEVHTRPSLEERLESIISGAALMADSSCTRDERRERIVAECNAVRQALQDLLSEYMTNVSNYFNFYSNFQKFGRLFFIRGNVLFFLDQCQNISILTDVKHLE